MNKIRTALAGAALLASALVFAQTPAPAPAEKLSYTDDYRISVNHDAESDGVIVFRVVTKKDPATTDITVPVKKGTSENDVARVIKEAFKAQLGTKGYNIEGEDGENVIIEGTGGKTYSLVLVSTTVNGAKVSIHHD